MVFTLKRRLIGFYPCSWKFALQIGDGIPEKLERVSTNIWYTMFMMILIYNITSNIQRNCFSDSRNIFRGVARMTMGIDSPDGDRNFKFFK